MEASKFTTMASIRVSMGTSQTTYDSEDVHPKGKSLITVTHLSLQGSVQTRCSVLCMTIVIFLSAHFILLSFGVITLGSLLDGLFITSLLIDFTIEPPG